MGGVVIVVGSIEIGGHYADVIRAILPVQELTVLETGDFRQRVCLVGFLQLGGQQAAFLHGLGRHAGIDAGGAEKLQLPAAVFPCGVDHVHFQNHVVVHKIRQGILVGHNAAHLGGSQEYILRLFRFEKGFHLILPGQVQFLMSTGDDVAVALPLQFPDNGGAHHAPVARHIDFRVFLHHFAASSIAFSFLASSRSCFAMISTSCA